MISRGNFGRSHGDRITQRLSALFDECHGALWTELEARQNTPQLLRLFRHTSFLWRIRGHEEKEVVYLRRLEQHAHEPTESLGNSRIVIELKYFFSRLAVVLKVNRLESGAP